MKSHSQKSERCVRARCSINYLFSSERSDTPRRSVPSDPYTPTPYKLGHFNILALAAAERFKQVQLVCIGYCRRPARGDPRRVQSAEK